MMTLENYEVLQTLAEVSVTLAGFIGVILVLQSAALTREARTKNAIFHLLLGFLGATGLAILPLILQAAVSDKVVWQISLPILGFVHLFGAFRSILDYKRGEPGLPLIWIFTPVSFLIAIGSVAVLLGYIMSYASPIYLFGLGWGLLVSTSAFLKLIYHEDS